MKLQIYKTLWGHDGDFDLACRQAVEHSFDGIEGPPPKDATARKQWRALLREHQLLFVAEICTAGSYVPDRHASLQDHLHSLEQQLKNSVDLSPEFVTCLGGCDAWSEDLSIEFFERAMELAARFDMTISFETHRGRSLFNPWVTERICQQLPTLKLTCDFSHWCVVCERLLDGEEQTLQALFPHAFHIHARVGYDQGAQVADPSAEVYRPALEKHQQWWRQIGLQKKAQGDTVITMTPEFGPDGYQAIDAVTNEPVGDLWQINCWMAQQQRAQFSILSETAPVFDREEVL